MTALPFSQIVLLLCISYPQPGTCAIPHTVYSKEGDDATLPCANVVYEDCTGTTWLYRSPGSGHTVEEVSRGRIKSVQTQRAHRLKLEPNCSLTISAVTRQDAGQYYCQQFLTADGAPHGEQTVAHLAVLTASSTTPASKMKAHNTVDFFCQLVTHDCEQYRKYIDLKWAGYDHHEHTVVYLCHTSLRVVLRQGDNNRTLRCTLNQYGELKASVDYTIRLRDAAVEDATVDINAVFEMGVRFFIVFTLLFLSAVTVYVYYRMRRKPKPQRDGAMELETTG